MANPGFLNDNQFRDYPFLTRLDPLSQADYPSEPLPLQALPPSAIVDAGAIMYAGSQFAAEHRVYLCAISRDGDNLYYDLRSDAPGAENTRCLFQRQVTAAECLTEWVEASFLDGSATDSAACDGIPNWEAFLSTGRCDELAALLSDGEAVTFPFGLWTLEPSRVQNLAGTYVQTLNLANFPRHTASPPIDCLTGSESAAPTDPYTNAICMTGNIAFREGFNANIRQERGTSTIWLGAARGAGAGEPCEEVPLFESEPTPADSRFLTGGPGCDEILTAINGVGGRDLVLRAGPGFRIYADPDIPHALVIDRSLQDFAVCAAHESESSSSSSASLGGP